MPRFKVNRQGGATMIVAADDADAARKSVEMFAGPGGAPVTACAAFPEELAMPLDLLLDQIIRQFPDDGENQQELVRRLKAIRQDLTCYLVCNRTIVFEEDTRSEHARIRVL